MHKVHRAYEALNKRTEHIATVMKLRSVRLQPYVSTLLELLAYGEFKAVISDASVFLRNAYDSIIGQSIVIERFIQRERTAESLQQMNQVMAWDRIWWLPVQRGLLPQHFRMP